MENEQKRYGGPSVRHSVARDAICGALVARAVTIDCNWKALPAAKLARKVKRTLNPAARFETTDQRHMFSVGWSTIRHS
jgi:hypothetical protein